jgi:tetratricopeptide (TPR) repeat protein
VLAAALLFQAHEQALGQRYDVERALLMRAFASAPKAIESAVLGQLMSCHRSLRDHGAARQCAELMVAMTPPNSPELAGALYTLAMAQREDGLMDAAMDSIRAGLVANPEGWYLQVLRAGYAYSSGRREEGLADFAAVRAPRAEILMYDCMCTWFACVRGSRADFMAGVARVLAEDRSGYVLEWLDQDPDVHTFTVGDAEYAERIARHRAAILEEPAPAP